MFGYRTGIPLLDELRAITASIKILTPFGVSPQIQLTIQALHTRANEIRNDPNLHAVLGDLYDLGCAHLGEVMATHRKTGEQKKMLTCTLERCEFYKKAVDPDRPQPDCENFRVSSMELQQLLR